MDGRLASACIRPPRTAWQSIRTRYYAESIKAGKIHATEIAGDEKEKGSGRKLENWQELLKPLFCEIVRED